MIWDSTWLSKRHDFSFHWLPEDVLFVAHAGQTHLSPDFANCCCCCCCCCCSDGGGGGGGGGGIKPLTMICELLLDRLHCPFAHSLNSRFSSKRMPRKPSLMHSEWQGNTNFTCLSFLVYFVTLLTMHVIIPVPSLQSQCCPLIVARKIFLQTSTCLLCCFILPLCTLSFYQPV